MGKADLSQAAIEAFAGEVGVSAGIVLERLQHEGFLKHDSELNHVRARRTATAEQVGRGVRLRDEKREDGSWLNLLAYLDTEGRLHIDGQDLGPVAKFVSADGEYEYFKTTTAQDIPQVIKLLGGKPGDNVLDLLEQNWSGEKSYKLESLLAESGIPVALATWSG